MPSRLSRTEILENRADREITFYDHDLRVRSHTVLASTYDEAVADAEELWKTTPSATRYRVVKTDVFGVH